MGIIITENNIVYEDTGELIDPQKYISENCQWAKQSIENATKIAGIFKIPFNAKLVTYRHSNYVYANVKTKYLFQKTFQESAQELFKQKLSIYSKAFIGQFIPFLAFPQNYITVNGSNPTVNEFAELMGVNRKKMYDVLNQLEQLEVIKRVKRGKNNIVYVNPYLYSSGADVELDTLLMFTGSIYRG